MATHDPHAPVPDQSRSRTRCAARPRSPWPRTTREFSDPTMLAPLAERGAAASSWTRGTHSGRRRCSLPPSRSCSLGAALQATGAVERTRPRHGRRRHDRHRGRAPPAARRLAVRVADQRRRRTGCATRPRSTPATCATLDAARRALVGCDRIVHLAAIVGGIANFHKLPYTLLETNTGSTTRSSGPRSRVRWSGSSTCHRAWCSSAPRSSRRPRTHLDRCPTPRSAYGFSKLAGEYCCRAAPTSSACATRSCARSTRTGRGRCRATSRASRTSSPT